MMRPTHVPVPMTPPSPRLSAYGCLALSMTLVGCYVAFSKPLVAAIPVFLLAWLRFGIGALFMLRWLRVPSNEPPLSKRTQGLLFVESFFGNFLFTICMLSGVRLTGAVAAGVILAALPAVVALMSWAALGERVRPRVWAATGCAGLGIGLLAAGTATPAPTGGSAGAHVTWLGNALVFAAVLCEAAYAVVGKKLTGALGPRRITALVNLWGFALMTPFGLYAAVGFDFAAVPARIWPLLLFYALAASVWTVWLWMTGLRHVPSAEAGVFTVMLPLATTAVGVSLLGERPTALQGVALGFALAGVLLATWPVRSAQRR